MHCYSALRPRWEHVRMHRIDIIDSHTAGEPTRVVLGGFPDLGGGSLRQRRERLAREFDHWRAALACEPRGSDTMVGALLLPPEDPSACTGVIFFNNVGCLGMCGHGTIGVVRTLAELGRIQPGRHRIETPVGMVGVELFDDGRVAVDNVESWRHLHDVAVDVPGHGVVRGDVAWGGNWFFITTQAPCALTLANQRELSAYTEAIRLALERDGITGADGAIDHVEVNAAAPDGSGAARNFVLCPGLAYDRSPCGTGTSAKLACLAQDGKLQPGAIWRQASIIGSQFTASYQRAAAGIIPTIRGEAWVCGDNQLILNPDDPFCWGIAP